MFLSDRDQSGLALQVNSRFSFLHHSSDKSNDDKYPCTVIPVTVAQTTAEKGHLFFERLLGVELPPHTEHATTTGEPVIDSTGPFTTAIGIEPYVAHTRLLQEKAAVTMEALIPFRHRLSGANYKGTGSSIAHY